MEGWSLTFKRLQVYMRIRKIHTLRVLGTFYGERKWSRNGLLQSQMTNQQHESAWKNEVNPVRMVAKDGDRGTNSKIMFFWRCWTHVFG